MTLNTKCDIIKEQVYSRAYTHSAFWNQMFISRALKCYLVFFLIEKDKLPIKISAKSRFIPSLSLGALIKDTFFPVSSSFFRFKIKANYKQEGFCVSI